MGLVGRNLNNKSFLTEFLFVIFLLICIFSFFPYGLSAGLGVYFLRRYLSRAKKKKELERAEAESEKTIKKRKEILSKFKKRLAKKRKPDEVKEYKGCKVKIYRLPGNQRAIKISDWDNRTSKELFLTISDAKNAINRFCLYNPYSTKEEYLSAKEKELRKKEEIQYLARAYQRRKGNFSFKKGLIAVDNLFKLTPAEFEKWVKKHIFEKEGWQVSETKRTGDGGIDLILWKKNEKSIAQCKRFRKTVGEALVRDFYGAMVSEGVSRGYFVTTGLFSLSALKFAEDKPIEIIDRRVLAQKYITKI